jgi:hypothetical protein
MLGSYCAFKLELRKDNKGKRFIKLNVKSIILSNYVKLLFKAPYECSMHTVPSS